jgi:hypothetical protein
MESRAMTPALGDALRHITTGTITTILLKKGIRRCWMHGPMPLRSGQRVVGPAFTLRERMEGRIVSEVERGARLPGLYPMNAETKAPYEAWNRKKQG